MTDIQPVTNDMILRMLHIVLIEIRATDQLEKARRLADAFHNAPGMIASGQDPQDIWASILSTARRLEIEPYIISLLSHVRSRHVLN